MEVEVGDGGVDQALRKLKRKLGREGAFKEMRRRLFYSSPGEKRRNKRQLAERRREKDRQRLKDWKARKALAGGGL
jgi:small subunit ribosomal protein S21